MSEATKTCNLTEKEIKGLIQRHGFKLSMNHSEATIERINYLNKRLKAFNEPAADIKSKPATAAGWVSN